METYWPLRVGLFIFECVRLFFLLGSFAVLRPDEGAAVFPWISCLAANALFPLMALFLLLDSSRYCGYGPLYTAGKAVSFFAVLVWCIFFRQRILSAAVFEQILLFTLPGILGILIMGDLCSVTAGLFIIRKTRPARILSTQAAQSAATTVQQGGE
ncbi:MAG: hypothetical protein LBD55_07195 [Treponema sp.]|jgi:hypothetical protein|nr:hypothetical protein [Treponema sp.]